MAAGDDFKAANGKIPPGARRRIGTRELKELERSLTAGEGGKTKRLGRQKSGGQRGDKRSRKLAPQNGRLAPGSIPRGPRLRETSESTTAFVERMKTIRAAEPPKIPRSSSPAAERFDRALMSSTALERFKSERNFKGSETAKMTKPFDPEVATREMEDIKTKIRDSNSKTKLKKQAQDDDDGERSERELKEARLAVERFDQGDIGAAMDLVSKGLNRCRSPEALAIYLSLSGYSRLVSGEPERALKALDESISLLDGCETITAVEKSDIYYRLADLCERLRNVPRGLRAIGHSIEILMDLEESGRLRRAISAKGRLYYLMRQYEKARRAFENALSCEGSDPETWKLFHGIAKCYDKLGFSEEAKVAYENSRRYVMRRAQDKFDKLIDSDSDAAKAKRDTVREERPELTDSPSNVFPPRKVADTEDRTRAIPFEENAHVEKESVNRTALDTVRIETLPDRSPVRVRRWQIFLAPLTLALLLGGFLAYTYGIRPLTLPDAKTAAELKALRDAMEALRNQAAIEKGQLYTRLARAELGARKPGSAAAWAARAYESLAAVDQGHPELAEERARIVDLAEAAVAAGPWGWTAVAGEPIAGLALSRDGALLASAGARGGLRVWSAATGALLRSEDSSRGQAFAGALTFDSGGRILAAAREDGALVLWDWQGSAEAGIILKALPDGARALSFAPNTPRLLSLAETGAARLWSAVTRASIDDPALARMPALADARFFPGPDGGEVAVIASRGLELRSLESGAARERVDAELGPDARFLAAPGGLLTAEPNGRLRLWRRGEAGLGAAAEARLPRGQALAFSGALLVAAEESELVLYRWPELATATRRLKAGAAVRAAAFLPHGQSLVSVDAEGRLRSWDVQDLAAEQEALSLEARGPALMASGPAGPVLAAGGSDLRAWRLSAAGAAPIALAEAGAPRALALSRDGAFLARVDAEGELIIIPLEDGAERRFRCDQPVSALAISDDGRRLAVGSERGDLLLLDGEGRPLRAYRGKNAAGRAHAAAVDAVAFSPDGEALASLARGELSRWDTKQEEAVWSRASPGARRLLFWGEELLVSAEDGAVTLFDAAGAPRSCGPRGQAMAVGGGLFALAAEGRVALCDGRGRCLTAFESPKGIKALAFGPGPRLFLLDEDGAVHGRALGGQGFSRSRFEAEPRACIAEITGEAVAPK